MKLKKVRLIKRGQIYIPISIRKQLDFKAGDLLNIILVGEKIVLNKKEGYEKENKAILNQKGSIHIPIEIRRLINFKNEVFFKAIIDQNRKEMNLIPY